MARFLLILGILSLFGGCKREEPEAEAPPTPTTLPSPAQWTMHGRYMRVDDVRAALVRADIEEVRKFTRGLERPLQFPNLPASALPLPDEVPRNARAILAATSTREAAVAFADMMRACGDCHRATSVRMNFPPVEAKPGEELVDHMRRFATAVRQMSEGLMFDDSTHYRRGAALLDAKSYFGDEPVPEEHPRGLTEIAQQLDRDAREAHAAATPERRAALFATVLGGCASCHAKIRSLDEGGPQEK